MRRSKQRSTDDEFVRAAKAKKGSPFLDTAQAAHYVSLSRRTLEKMRSQGGGPWFRKHGRYVRYHINDLDAWSADHLKLLTSKLRRRPPSRPKRRTSKPRRRPRSHLKRRKLRR